MHGNMLSRWVDFLTSDGEKESRDRDGEFEPTLHSRSEIEKVWKAGWQEVYNALEPLSEADLDYSTEKAEGRMARLINAQMLHSEGKYSLDLDSLRKPVLSEATKNILVDFIESQESKYANWGFKDPRTVLTYELWRDHLPRHKLILIYRPLDQVWRHYTRNRLKGLKAISYRTLRKGVRAIRAWEVYNQKLLEYLEMNKEESILIDYDAMMEDVQILRELERFTQKELVDCRRGGAKSLSMLERAVFNFQLLIYRLKYTGNTLKGVLRGLQASSVGARVAAD